MRTDLYSFEAALYRLLRMEPGGSVTIPAEEWPAVLQLADREGVMSLLHPVVAASESNVPDSVHQILAASYRHAAQAAGTAYAQLADVLRALHAHGVSVVLLKGAALARFTYGDAALRPFADLDLLVRSDQVEVAHQAMRSAGYALVGEAPSPTDVAWRHARGYFDPAGSQASRERAGSGARIPVDLHWRLAGYPLTVETEPNLFALAVPVEIENSRALIPAPTAMLVALGIHFMRDVWYAKPRLRYVRDAVEVVRRHSVDWNSLTQTVRRVPLARTPVFLVLSAAKSLLGAPIPDEMLKTMWPQAHGPFARYLQHRTSRCLLRDERPHEAFLQIALMKWLDAPSLGAYARWLSAVAFVPRGLKASRRRWLNRVLARKPQAFGPDV